MARGIDGRPPRKGKNGNKTHGRNKAKCEIYRKENRREKNKALRQERIRRRLEKRKLRRKPV